MIDPTQLQIESKPLLPLPAMLTKEDVEFIELLIDEKIKAANSRTALSQKDYHTADDIRALIRRHLPEFREFVGDEDFPVNVLRFFLRKKATLRPRDTEMVDQKGESPAMRFFQQVGNAIQPAAWPNSPFESVRPGSYRIRRTGVSRD